MSVTEHASLERSLWRRDLARLISEQYETQCYGRPRQRSPNFVHPPLTLRPHTAQARLCVTQSAPKIDSQVHIGETSQKTTGETPNLPPLEDLNGKETEHRRRRVFTLCATSYQVNNCYSSRTSGLLRVATPNNRRIDRKAAESDVRERSEAAHAVVTNMFLDEGHHGDSTEEVGCRVSEGDRRSEDNLLQFAGQSAWQSTHPQTEDPVLDSHGALTRSVW
eukprot:CAMPEP_0177602154 /NCGR_PEP_ID=MMETSP0419_2-20121207/14702_1 /TAXON_ID=582737 /ORGANISM="Tetraselmis sp., Strain GSL018" /LENGTH=220 /DNA_ID=CAMNT_0019095589 /DNA_START=285 /DNA_END=944 /DNA_ORIENTATION=+